MEVIIEEGIWNIETRMPIKSAVFKCDNVKITRQLYDIERSKKWNSKIDTIDHIRVNLSDISSLNSTELGEKIKGIMHDCFDRNVNNEIPFFEFPIITRK